MKAVLAVAVGGAAGAIARYAVYLATSHWVGTGFPLATIVVNVLGSFALGVLVEGMALAWSPSAELRLFLIVGILGSFTTFSTFSLDFAVLYERGAWPQLTAYTVASVAFSIGALFAGMRIARLMIGAGE